MQFQIIDNEPIATEPISLAEAKAYMQIDADYASDDTQINIAIISARLRLEQWLNVGLVQREIKVLWNGQLLKPPLIPIGQISGVKKNDEVNNLDPDKYTIIGFPKGIVINELSGLGHNYFYSLTGNVEISLTEDVKNTDYYTVSYLAGYESLPALLKQALLAEVDYIYKLRGLPATVNISPNAKQLASGYSNNLIIQ